MTRWRGPAGSGTMPGRHVLTRVEGDLVSTPPRPTSPTGYGHVPRNRAPRHWKSLPPQRLSSMYCACVHEPQSSRCLPRHLRHCQTGAGVWIPDWCSSCVLGRGVRDGDVPGGFHSLCNTGQHCPPCTMRSCITGTLRKVIHCQLDVSFPMNPTPLRDP